MRKQTTTKWMSLGLATIMGIGMLTGCGSSTDSKDTDTAATADSKAEESAETETETDSGQYADTITIVWYPNESADTYTDAREEVAKLVKQATGKEVEQKLTTDYTISIEAISSGNAQIGCCFGAEGYVQAKESNDAVNPLFTESGESGTLDDAMYYSFFAVKDEDAKEYEADGGYSIDNIQGKTMSFVADSSTSGFKVPTNNILALFTKKSGWEDLTVDDLMEGGEDALFSEVLFGGSHQGSAYNLLSGKADVAAFCNTELDTYAELAEGEDAQVGSVYSIKEGADAPFDTLEGEKYTVISSTPVMNGPFLYNGDTLSPEDAQAIIDLFTSDEVANNPLMFYEEGSDVNGIYEKSGDMHFVEVEDSWYDPIREME